MTAGQIADWLRSDRRTRSMTMSPDVFADLCLALETMLRERAAAKPTPGTCRVCGCTDSRACRGGCCWTDEARTLCSGCACAACGAPIKPKAVRDAEARNAAAGDTLIPESERRACR